MKAFQDRKDAGRQLAERLHAYFVSPPPGHPPGLQNATVVAVSGGGLEVGNEVAIALGVSLQVLASCRLPLPDVPEVTLGALAEGGICVLNEPLLRRLAGGEAILRKIEQREALELERVVHAYRGGRPLDVAGKTVILVDDGVLTGCTLWVCLASLQRMRPARIVVALPVAPLGALAEVRQSVPDVICLRTPPTVARLAQYYENYPVIQEAEALALLGRAPVTASVPPEPPDCIRLVVPVDGRDEAAEAVRHVAALADGHASHVLLLQVVGPGQKAQAEAGLRELERQTRASLGTACSVGTRVEEGEPLERILHVARDWEAHGILMATRRPGRLVDGLLREAPCQVQVILVSKPSELRPYDQEQIRERERLCNREHVLWLEEVEAWKRESQAALRSLQERLLLAEQSRLDEHLQVILEHEQAFARHSQMLSSQAADAQLVEEHQQMMLEHAQQHELHERLRQRHAHIVESLRALMEVRTS